MKGVESEKETIGERLHAALVSPVMTHILFVFLFIFRNTMSQRSQEIVTKKSGEENRKTIQQT